jgi:hypothetical protein
MNQDLRPTPEINPYEPHNNLQPADSLIPDVSSLPVKLIVVAIMSFLIGMFVLGMPPSAGAFDYTRNIPISEAVTASLTANWPSVLSRTAGMAFFFLVPAVGGLMLYLLGPRRWMPRILVIAILSVPLLPFALIVFVNDPFLLIRAAAGQADGETWSEGFVCFGAIGYWACLWLMLIGMAWLRQRSIKRRQGLPV